MGGEFDAALRARAAAAGARIVAAKAEPVAADGGVSVRVGGAEERFDFVIGADGAFSAVRRAFAGIPTNPNNVRRSTSSSRDRPRGGGAPRVLQRGHRLFVGFPEARPRERRNGGEGGELPAAAMRERVRDFVGKRFPGARTVRSVGWVIPAPSRGIATSQLSSACHALVGDAAGLADPLTGEGIYYAIVSGALAARAIARGSRSATRPTSRRRSARSCESRRASSGATSGRGSSTRSYSWHRATAARARSWPTSSRGGRPTRRSAVASPGLSARSVGS